jgi:ribosome biogenesis GTPase / thiamine phosphate phosphatase
MTVELSVYGWTERLEEAFTPHAAAGLVPARVTLEHTHVYRVVGRTGELLARVAGRLRHQAGARADFPAVGDWVAIEPPHHGGDARIRVVLPRVSRFSRKAAGDPTEEQVIAANIDTVFLVAGLDHDFNPRRLERYLLVAGESGASPVVILNKADLVADAEARIAEVRSLAPAVPVYAVSCRMPETLEPIRWHLGPGRTGALLGSSGVGKSTIVNRLIGEDLLATEDVRASDSRGRHTSTNRQLVLIPDVGLVIDTPGLRELQLWDAGGWAGTFADIAALAERCRFRDCRHRQEPGCAVVAAVEAGELPASRHESYLKLSAEQEHVERQQDVRAQLDVKRQSKVGAKALGKRVKEKGQS